MRFLVDTMVLSELRRPRPLPAVLQWLRETPAESLFVSVATVAELERGAAAQRRREPAQAAALEAWISTTLSAYGDRILAVDRAIARRWGRLSGTLGYENIDLLIAATALEHGMTVATRDARGFERTGVSIVDPFILGA